MGAAIAMAALEGEARSEEDVAPLSPDGASEAIPVDNPYASVEIKKPADAPDLPAIEAPRAPAPPTRAPDAPTATAPPGDPPAPLSDVALYRPPGEVRALGPALTVLGAAALVGGAGASAYASTMRCGHSCGGKLGLLIGGALGGGSVAGLFMAVGLDAWTRDLGDAPDELGTPRADPLLMGLGIPTLSLGGVALAVGLFGNIGSYNGLSGTWHSGEPWLPPLIVGGAAGLAVGATMIVLGKRKLVPVDAPTARLHVGPASFVVEGTF